MGKGGKIGKREEKKDSKQIRGKVGRKKQNKMKWKSS